MSDDPKIRTEEFKVSGSALIDRVKDLFREGNIRRISIKKDDDTLIELPLTVAAVGAVLAPQLAAVGALAALVTSCSIVVERIVDDEQDDGAEE